jgi:DNA-binding NtrC family response regulator
MKAECRLKACEKQKGNAGRGNKKQDVRELPGWTTTEAIGRGEFGYRIEYPGRGELRELAEDLNRTVSQLEATTVSQGDLQKMTDRLRKESAERRHIERVLAAENGHVQRAAVRLGIPRSTLYQKIKSLGIGPC